MLHHPSLSVLVAAPRVPPTFFRATLRRLRISALRTQSHAAMMAQGLVLVVLIGFLDCLSGCELSFSLFYLAPIILVTWWAGRQEGVAVASLSALVWLGADMLSGHRFIQPLIPVWNTLMRVSCFLIVVILLAQLKRSYEAQRRMARELQASLTQVKILSGLIPICAWCKQVRDDQGYWQHLEAYIAEHSDATFTHSICQACEAKELQILRHQKSETLLTPCSAHLLPSRYRQKTRPLP